jgi:hypothetical protein
VTALPAPRPGEAVREDAAVHVGSAAMRTPGPWRAPAAARLPARLSPSKPGPQLRAGVHRAGRVDVLFASDEAPFITGACPEADGGRCT